MIRAVSSSSSSLIVWTTTRIAIPPALPRRNTYPGHVSLRLRYYDPMKRIIGVFVFLSAASAFAADSVTFHKDVEPILQANCQSCHRPGQVAPMALLTYQDARPWAKAIKTAVLSKKMPPWFADPRFGHFANDRTLPQSDIDT